jgi:hypothetical protein
MCSAVQAAVFTIDSNLSVLNFSGTDINGAPLVAQANGRFTAHPSGTVIANISGGMIDFPGGSASALDSDPGPFQPFNAPANFAGQTAAGDALFAIRNEVSDIVGGPQPIDLAGNFSAAATLPILAGTFDYDVAGFGSGCISLPVSPGSTTNSPAAEGLLQQVGNQLILTIPIDTTSTFLINDIAVGHAHYVGQTVATMTIPEPATITLAVLGALALLAYRRRR